MNADLATWLRVQVDEDEATTRELLYWAQQTILTLQDPRLLGKCIPGWHDWPKVERICTDRLAEIDAKRRIVDDHYVIERKVGWTDDEGEERQSHLPVCVVCVPKYSRIDTRTQVGPCNTVKLLAMPYAGRYGYQEEWRP